MAAWSLGTAQLTRGPPPHPRQPQGRLAFLDLGGGCCYTATPSRSRGSRCPLSSLDVLDIDSHELSVAAVPTLDANTLHPGHLFFAGPPVAGGHDAPTISTCNPLPTQESGENTSSSSAGSLSSVGGLAFFPLPPSGNGAGDQYSAIPSYSNTQRVHKAKTNNKIFKQSQTTRNKNETFRRSQQNLRRSSAASGNVPLGTPCPGSPPTSVPQSAAILVSAVSILD